MSVQNLSCAASAKLHPTYFVCETWISVLASTITCMNLGIKHRNRKTERDGVLKKVSGAAGDIRGAWKSEVKQ